MTPQGIEFRTNLTNKTKNKLNAIDRKITKPFIARAEKENKWASEKLKGYKKGDTGFGHAMAKMTLKVMKGTNKRMIKAYKKPLVK